jgi:type II secretory pathway pseudopilin PulG
MIDPYAALTDGACRPTMPGDRQAAPARRRTGERGVGLVEVVVVLVIIAVTLGMVFSGRNSSQRAGSVTVGRAAAASYKDAIEAFRRDHGGRTPVWGSAADWPATPPASSGVTGGSGGSWGPLNQGARMRPYLDVIPEAITDRRVVLVGGASSLTPMTVRARVVYDRIDERRYRLILQRSDGDAWVAVCRFGTEGGKAC